MFDSKLILSLEDIQANVAAEAEKFLNNDTPNTEKALSPHSVEQRDVLSEILRALEPLDFHKAAGLEPNENLTQKHTVVLTVQEVLRIAKKIKCDLCRNGDFVYTYNGAFWELLEPEQIEQLLGEASERLGVDHVTATYHKFREQLFKQFLAIANLPKPPITKGVSLINLQNGTFEAHSDKFFVRAFNNKDFLTYQLPFGYDENATCPKWKAFLDEVLPDPEKQMILAEFFAYVFTKLKLEKTLLLLGVGQNGKSVVFDVIKALFGEVNISHYTMDSLRREYHRAMLANKLLNYSSEISTRLESDIFKKLSSGEPCDARLPYGKPFIIKDYARLAFNCNKLPRDVEHTNAFFRRFLIIKFDVRITDEQKKPHLAEEINETELSGVFNWLLEGLQRLLKQSKFSDCQAAQTALDEYRHNSDSIAIFAEETNYKKVSDRDKGTLLRIIYIDYKSFCQECNFRPVSIQTFGTRLRDLGLECLKTNKGILVLAKKSPENLMVIETPINAVQEHPF